MINNLTFWRILTLIGLLGLMLTFIIWNGWLTPIQYLNRGIEIAIFEFPLLFFIRGIFNGDRDKHVTISLLSLLYFFIGVWFIFAPQESLYGYAITLLSLCLYFGGFFYARTLDKMESSQA